LIVLKGRSGQFDAPNFDMARHNDVRLFGCVADTPFVVQDDSGNILSARVHLAVVKNDRNDHLNDIESLKYDWPLINSYDADMARQISKLKLYDVVEIQGVLVTQNCKKITYCKNCGTKNEVQGTIEYVYPVFLIKRNAEDLTKKQALQMVIENRPISNNISITGNLCNDPTYFKDPGMHVETGTYQIGCERNLFLKFDDPAVKSDFPFVRTYGKDAEKDFYCLHKKSSVLVEGYLHTRKFQRKSTCQDPSCQKEYEWDDTVTEIISYNTQYCANYTDPNTIDIEAERAKQDEEKRQKDIAEGEQLAAQLF
jgi:single-stranded DNA-binding protein